MSHKAEGIILRKYLLRETSYILVIFTKEFGKIRGVLKGVRKPYPQFAGNFEIFTHVEVLFYKKKQLDLITQCETLDFFPEIRKDILRLTYANYFIELIDIVTNDYDKNDYVFNILVESLEMLSSSSSARRIARIFEIRLLKAIGMSPQIDECVICGGGIEENGAFSVKNGGMICRKCSGKDGSKIDISLGALKFLRKIQTEQLDKIYHIKVSKEVGEEIEKILGSFIRFHINRPIRSLSFLDQLTKSEITT